MGEGINRISGIVSDLRTFTHPNLTQLEQVPVVEVVNSALRLLSNEWENKVIIEKEIPQNQTIWANRNQITQVLVNLVQNSLQRWKRNISLKLQRLSGCKELRTTVRASSSSGTTAKELFLKIFTEFSIPFSPPRMSERVWDWGSAFATVS